MSLGVLRDCWRREFAIVQPDVQPSGILQTGGMLDTMMETQNSRGGREEGRSPAFPLPQINSGKINPCAREIKGKHSGQGVSLERKC